MSDDGFYKLIPKKEPKQKLKNPKRPKFKKGSWKHWYYKRLKRFHGSTSFKCTHARNDNYLIWKNIYGCGELKIEPAHNKPAAKELKLLKSGTHDKSIAYVMVDMGDMTYTKVPVKSYFKLMQINKMIIGTSLRITQDDGSTADIWQDEKIICNLSELFQFINFHRQGINGVYDMIANGYGFAECNYHLKLVVCKTDGSVETYKGDMNNFMKAYGLYQF